MDLAAAREVLGVEPDTAWPEVRAAYLRLVRRSHPDGAFDLADSGRRTIVTAQLTEAFAVVDAARRADDPAARPASGAQSGSPGATRTAAPASGAAAWGSATWDDHLGASFRHPTVALDDTRTVMLDAEPMDAFLALHEAFSVLGAVSYIDRLSFVLEAIVTPEPGRATSLLVWLDPGPGTTTQATLGVESLGGHPPADLDALVDRLADLLASPRPPVGSA